MHRIQLHCTGTPAGKNKAINCIRKCDLPSQQLSLWCIQDSIHYICILPVNFVHMQTQTHSSGYLTVFTKGCSSLNITFPFTSWKWPAGKPVFFSTTYWVTWVFLLRKWKWRNTCFICKIGIQRCFIFVNGVNDEGTCFHTTHIGPQVKKIDSNWSLMQTSLKARMV